MHQNNLCSVTKLVCDTKSSVGIYGDCGDAAKVCFDGKGTETLPSNVRK